VRVIQTESAAVWRQIRDDNASVICAILALKAGKPVKLIHTREEEFLASPPAHADPLLVRSDSARRRVKAKEIKVSPTTRYTANRSHTGAATVRHDALYKYPCARAIPRWFTNWFDRRIPRFRQSLRDWRWNRRGTSPRKNSASTCDLLRMNAVESGDVSPHNHRSRAAN